MTHPAQPPERSSTATADIVAEIQREISSISAAVGNLACHQEQCDTLGGVPDDPGKQVELRCAFDVAAERELSRLMEMPDDFRRALAHRLWPASRGEIRSFRSGRAHLASGKID